MWPPRSKRKRRETKGVSEGEQNSSDIFADNFRQVVYGAVWLIDELHDIGALMEIRRKKMLEKEVSKLDAQMMVLDQQRMMIECKQNPSVITPCSEHCGCRFLQQPVLGTVGGRVAE
jgi:hypothetical protein